ncbi:uncharacterized protein FPRO_10346 [Fusarium proliferatum ET1]|uniref:Uncharacterized protein n=1 Tax=Fusarium proliferatum (strain ET1) TaxID=1227346 RepID=A0A1L7VJN1_FUSPR|nr:uncharacterized protein FPRO_10346 [Fusarium proliferatum ET1]CZR40758.1 uncharacterized protein FPRO_10346 [Fusarium proliferatum ET1]
MTDQIDPIGDALANFFIDFHHRKDSVPGQPTAQFGHIKIPPYRLETSIRKQILDMFPEEKYIMFVVPDIEPEVEQGYLSNGHTTIKIMAYHRLFEHIRSNFNRDANESDHTIWLKYKDPERRYRGGWLPQKIVIIFQIDPNIPADCAISLAGIVEWSLAQSTLPDHNIRLVTLSAEEDCDLLKRLLDTSGLQYHFADLDLAQHGELDPLRNCTIINSKYMDTQVSNILARVRGEPEKSRLILCFDIAFYRALEAKQSPEDDQFIDKGRFAIGSGDYSRLVYRLEGPNTRLMLIAPDVAILPLTIKDFEEIHVVLGYSKTAQVWDIGLHQMVRRDYPLSMEDRRRQLWWAYQGNEKSVFMHIQDGLSPHEYIEQGYAGPRFVEAHQLGGFIATVTSLPWFSRNRDGIIKTFATNPFVVREITDRLIRQQVIKSNGSALTSKEADIFVDTLPLLNYDYRLALLVATEASPVVNRIKTQLAAMLTTNLEDIVTLDKIPRLPDCIFKECRGFGPPLAGQGSLWLFLGLLRNRDQHIQEHDEYMSLYDNLDGFVSVDESVGGRIEKVFGRLAYLVGRHGRDINHRPFVLMETGDRTPYAQSTLLDDLLPCWMEFEDMTPYDQRMLHGYFLPLLKETEEMTPEEQRELHGDLFRAYMYQATVCHEQLVGDGSHSGSPTICTLSGGSRCVLGPPDMSPTNLIDILGLLRGSGDKTVIGFSHSLETEFDNNTLILRDWTLIPKDVVYEWEKKAGPVGSVLAMLEPIVSHEGFADDEV